MSEQLLEKLQVKPVPELPRPVKFRIGEIKTIAIRDRRSESKINREELLAKVKNKITVKESEPLDNKKPKKLRIIKKRIKEVGDKEYVPRVLIGKKLKGKRVRLGTIKRDTMSELGILAERKTAAPNLKVISEEREEGEMVEKEIDFSGLPKNLKKVNIKASQYYLNNRKKFIIFINDLYEKYREELERKSEEPIEVETKCSEIKDKSRKFELLTHQNIVRDYLNMYSPYRGLLLYHGLGSGKTCSSIAIAEGMKNSKRVIVMIPASLKMNYIEELKKCGDQLYKRNQCLEFIKADGNTLKIEKLQQAMSVSKDYIIKQDGAWLVNVNKAPNFDGLTREEQIAIDKQLDEMIGYKYQFINYNGLRQTNLKSFKQDGNIFDDSVIIIDEVHNFVSRIVGKLKKTETLSYQLYELLLNARNCKIVLLTGTPIINYPNEIAVIYNILCGYINVWNISVETTTRKKIDSDEMKRILNNDIKMVDYIEYNPNSGLLKITKNPYGYINVFKDGSYKGMKAIEKGEANDKDYINLLIRTYEESGIRVDESMIDLDLYRERGSINDEGFLNIIEQSLAKHGVNILNKKNIQIEQLKLLPDSFDDFKSKFINPDNSVKDIDLLQRRILGMTSYYGDIEELMPEFDEISDIHTIEIPMSDEQLLMYELARNDEREQDKRNKRKKKVANNDVYEENTSTYRIFSRQFCNFVFPTEHKRPMPKDSKEAELANNEADGDNMITPDEIEPIVDLVPTEARLEQADGTLEPDDVLKLEEQKGEVLDDGYANRVQAALQYLSDNRETVLSKEGLKTYSPKFLHMLENILDVERHQGLHLVYSNFRTLEGIGILKLVFEANGMAEFKLKKDANGWVLDISPENMSKPKFALYTGTEDAELKELIRKIYNGMFDDLPTSLSEQLKAINVNNNMGEIIKVLMITASGAEGISLQNCRFVHITEPYWHPVRTRQVIGRARRICSHSTLPKEYQTVKVFQYIMVFSEEQKKSKVSAELRKFDVSKINNKLLFTSDQALLEISNTKDNINKNILKAIKETSIDCSIHASRENKGNLSCYSFGADNTDNFAANPNIEAEESDRVGQANKEIIKGKIVEIQTKEGIKLAWNQGTNELYDLNSYLDYKSKKREKPLVKGRIEIQVVNGKKKKKIVGI